MCPVHRYTELLCWSFITIRVLHYSGSSPSKCVSSYSFIQEWRLPPFPLDKSEFFQLPIIMSNRLDPEWLNQGWILKLKCGGEWLHCSQCGDTLLYDQGNNHNLVTDFIRTNFRLLPESFISSLLLFIDHCVHLQEWLFMKTLSLSSHFNAPSSSPHEQVHVWMGGIPAHRYVLHANNGAGKYVIMLMCTCSPLVMLLTLGQITTQSGSCSN